jgi:hypothetical protein
MREPAVRSNDDVADDREPFTAHIDAHFLAELSLTCLGRRLTRLQTTTDEGPPWVPDGSRDKDMVLKRPQAGTPQAPRNVWSHCPKPTRTSSVSGRRTIAEIPTKPYLGCDVARCVTPGWGVYASPSSPAMSVRPTASVPHP